MSSEPTKGKKAKAQKALSLSLPQQQPPQQQQPKEPQKKPWKSRLFGQDAIFQTIRDLYHDLPHIFLTGPPGSGKTTLLEDIIAMMRAEAPFDIESVLYLSSEKDRGIHTIRDKVNDFCKRTHSRPNCLRWIVVDDADTLPLISQQALRRPMETFSHLTRFLFASRYISNIIEPLRSRCMGLEIEPLSPIDAFPLYLQVYDIAPDSTTVPQLLDMYIRNFTSINDLKSILKLYKVYSQTMTPQEAMKQLAVLLPSSKQCITRLVDALSAKDSGRVREEITNLYLNGYLLDDILLGIEKSISIFPNTNPEIRFSILQFTMLGWISIQQGKEHWLDTMDIVEQVLHA